MARVTWIGSADSPDQVEWLGKVFIKDEPVEIEDEGLLQKALGNKFFKVEGYEAPAAKHDEPVTHRPPSEQSAQGPVPKAGEPIAPEGLQMTPDKAVSPGEDNEKSLEQHPAVQAVHRKPPPTTRKY